MMNSKTKRIAILSNTSWSIYNFRLGLIKSLIDSNISVLIIAPQDEFSPKLEEIGCEFQAIQLKNYSINPIWDIYYLVQLFFLLRKKQINYLISYTIKPNIYGSLVSRFLTIPNLAVVTGLGHLFTQLSWKTTIAKLLYRFSLKNTPQVWFLNREDRDTFLEQGIVHKSRTFILPSEGVDTHFFQKNKFAGRNPGFNFLFAGRLMEEKGIHDYVKAAKIVKEQKQEVNFIVLGFLDEGSPHAISKSQLDNWEKEGAIQFKGATANIKKHLEKVDCVVLPSYYREGVPRILLEAASMEIPIITTDNVGCREVIQHGENGFVCKPKDPASLAYWMEAITNIPLEKREEMGKSGRKMILSKFKEQFIIEYYIALLEKTFNSKLSSKKRKDNWYSLSKSFPIQYKSRSSGRK